VNARPSIPSLQRNGGRLRPADNLERAFVAKALHIADPRFSGGPEGVARSLWADDEVTLAVLQRAAVSPASTTVSGWASQLAATSVADFVESLKPQSAAAALIARCLKVPLNGSSTVTIPRRSGAPASVDAAWVEEGAPAPVIQYSLSGGTLGPMRKMVLITVVTRELATMGGEPVMRQLLRESVAATLDATLFGTAAATSAKPAGLRVGVTPIATSAATDTHEAMVEDISALIAALAAAGGGTDPVIIAAPGQAAAIALRAANYPVLSTPVLPAGAVTAVDAAAFASAFGSDPRFDASVEATVHYNDAAPAQISTGGTVASPVRSAFQQDLLVTKVTLDAAWTMRAPGLVQVVESVGW
jgi:hypothetical protein